MTEDQQKAANSLKRALNKAGKAGLSGGVFDGVFCLWPSDKRPDDSSDFFCGEVDRVGTQLFTPNIELDGGAGN